ncbi:GNAT family N-acetyltransferase [Chitinophaga japonensis]|uniref:RimJ/RimL family protein N-acetyltransferase n=1 Tax=Chitinophaga japonensis TaxID=104662 RepID=A0A562TCE2_CHIJA|nr:GNAT family N-acetyltransferase [Chitinophaga japonensis]TWI91221.1 RimJ/RimL family protein N-acetyltransferase [Chitinophaga japonensis]
MRHFLPNGQELLIRPATLEDAPALLQNFRRMVQETDFLMYTMMEAQSLDVQSERGFIQSFADNSRHLLLLAEVEGDIAGSVSVRQSAFRKQQHMGEMGIAVRHAFWNMGIGRRLMTAMLRWAAEHPVMEIIYFNVLANNEKAIQLYRNFDFIECGRQPAGIRQPDGTYVDLVHMYKRVK